MAIFSQKAPAKLNLGLDVTHRRADGYHELKTVFQTISLYDSVIIETVPSPTITIHCETPEVPCDTHNIAYRAAQAFYDATHITEGVIITLEKHIPMQAGLGGGSTDAASVLLALQEAYDNPLSDKQLHTIASRLGADVPFFLVRGTAYATGIGEILTPLPAFNCNSIVVAKGTEGISTADAYATIDTAKSLRHPDIDNLRAAIENNCSLKETASYCANLFEEVTHNDTICAIHTKMISLGAYNSAMTGSGAAIFGIFPDKEKAQIACEELQKDVEFVMRIEAE